MAREEHSGMDRREFLVRTGQAAVGAGLVSMAGGASGAPATEDLSLPYRLVETGSLESGMNQIRGIAVDPEGHLHTAGENGIRVLSAGGTLVRQFQTPGTPLGVDFDDEGFSFVVLRTKVLKYDPEGRLVAEWGERGKESGQFRYLTSIAVSGGFTYVADAGNRRVHRFAVDGDFVHDISGFHIPSAYFDCDVDGEGNLSVAHTSEHRVERYNRSGDLIGAWGEYGSAPEKFCGCCNPTNLAVFPDGRTATTEKGIPRLKVYDREGKLLAHLPGEALGVPENHLYLARLSEKGDGSLPCHDGWPGMPVAVDPKGQVVVSIPNTGRVRFYEIRPV